MTADQKSNVEILAYYIWEQNGRPHGRALDHWLEAEYLILTSSFVAGENRVSWAPARFRASS